MSLNRKHTRCLTAAGIAASCALALAAPRPAPAAPTPLDGNGMWIWVLSASGGTPTAVADQAERYGIDVVFVKSGDGDHYWSQFSEALVRTLHARGLEVCAWQFVYGGDPTAEARVAAAAGAAGADCVVIDAETTYEGRYEQAQIYMDKLRARVGPRYPLALTSFPYVDYHPSFPYSVFLAPGNAQFNVPQMYWKAIGTSVPANFDHTYRFNRPYDAPIFPLGQTWQDPSREEIIDFRRLARGYGAPGVSWWSWQETEGKEWSWVGRSLGRRPSRPHVARGFAVLAKGSTGDLVIWAQQHLKAAGYDIRVDGTFGPGTAGAVRAFQGSKGLEPTGTVSAITWKALLKYEPVATDWSRGRSGRDATRLPRRGAGVLAPELAPSFGRP